MLISHDQTDSWDPSMDALKVNNEKRGLQPIEQLKAKT